MVPSWPTSQHAKCARDIDKCIHLCVLTRNIVVWRVVGTAAINRLNQTNAISWAYTSTPIQPSVFAAHPPATVTNPGYTHAQCKLRWTADHPAAIIKSMMMMMTMGNNIKPNSHYTGTVVINYSFAFIIIDSGLLCGAYHAWGRTLYRSIKSESVAQPGARA